MATQPNPQGGQVPDPEKSELIDRLRRCHIEHTILSSRLSAILYNNERIRYNNERIRSASPHPYSNTLAEEAMFQAENSIFRKDTTDAFFAWFQRTRPKQSIIQHIEAVTEEIRALQRMIEMWRVENVRLLGGAPEERDLFGDREDARHFDESRRRFEESRRRAAP